MLLQDKEKEHGNSIDRFTPSLFIKIMRTSYQKHFGKKHT